MRPKLTTDRELLLTLTELFREFGFEGTSLAMIADASGLKKASLYHRFPDGKSDMALAVIDFTQQQFMEVLQPLSERGPVRKRLRKVAQNLGDYYDHGLRSCLIESLTVGVQSKDKNAVGQKIAEIIEDFIGGFAAVAREAGATANDARRRAEDAVIRFEGCLVLVRGTGNIQSFKRWMKELPELIAGGLE